MSSLSEVEVCGTGLRQHGLKAFIEGISIAQTQTLAPQNYSMTPMLSATDQEETCSPQGNRPTKGK